MRVGVNGRFYGAPVTGVQRFAREVARRLVDHIDMTLLLPADVPDTDDLPRRVPRMRGRMRGHLWEQLELPGLRNHAACDLLLHLSATAPVLGGPHVMAVHDVFPVSHPAWFAPGFARWYRVSLPRAARRAAAVLAMSRWAEGEIVRSLHVPRDRIRVVTQGVDPFIAPADASQVAAVKNRWGLADTYLLAVGAGDPRKNLRFLAQLLCRWGDAAPQLVVTGEGSPRVHGSRDHPEVTGKAVTYVGYVPDQELRALYTGAAAFCFPSLGEGFGRPPLEAMACGTPVVVADYGAAREVLGPAAEILPLDSERWIDALRRLVSNRERARCSADLEWVKQFRWDRTAADVADCCRDVVQRAAARRMSA